MAKGNEEKIVEQLFSSAGITINGKKPYDIQVHNKEFYKRLFNERALGLGESYMDGWWDCQSLDKFIDKILLANLENTVKESWKLKWHILKTKIFNLQKSSRAYQVGKHHYDIDNDLFQAMLDKRMLYSCGYWTKAKNLDEAQKNKLELICRKLNLKSGMRILDVGCGWGFFAKHLAEKYGAEVTAVTISKEQAEYSRKICKGLPVEILLEDYRNINGTYDRIVSIGMFEHVGYKNYRTYLEVVDRCLKEDGIAFIHTIGGNASTSTTSTWLTKYIFPNSMLPSIAQIGKAMEGVFVMEDWHNLGPDYDKTLMAWYANFEKAWPKLKKKYGERFYRMWRYYLLSCAGAFRSRYDQLWQIVMTKPGRNQPNCRIR